MHRTSRNQGNPLIQTVESISQTMSPQQLDRRSEATLGGGQRRRRYTSLLFCVIVRSFLLPKVMLTRGRPDRAETHRTWKKTPLNQRNRYLLWLNSFYYIFTYFPTDWGSFFDWHLIGKTKQHEYYYCYSRFQLLLKWLFLERFCEKEIATELNIILVVLACLLLLP